MEGEEFHRGSTVVIHARKNIASTGCAGRPRIDYGLRFLRNHLIYRPADLRCVFFATKLRGCVFFAKKCCKSLFGGASISSAQYLDLLNFQQTPIWEFI